LGEAVVAGTVASTVLIGLAYVFVSGRHPKIDTKQENTTTLPANTPQ
jgi:hypothetical protein